MAAAAAQKLEELKQCMKSTAVSQALVDHCTTQLQMATLEDFVYFVRADAFEAEVKTHIVDTCAATKDNMLAVARMRAAWKAAKAILQRVELRKAQNQSDHDLDEPLDSHTQESLVDAWQKHYHFSLSGYSMPADALLGRLFREIQRLTPTVIAVSKVKCLFVATKPQTDRSIQLGGNVRLHLEAEERSDVRSVFQYYTNLKVLMFGYSIVGLRQVESKLRPSTQVAYAPLTCNMQYPEYCLRKVMETEASPAGQLSWLKERDELTRSRMVELMRQSWPQGEALEKAMNECEVHWCFPHTHKRSFEPDAPMTPDKKLKTGNAFQGQPICKKRNDNRGCVKDEAKCPDKRLHRCDALKSDGSVCGSKSHSRMQRPHFLK